MGRRLFLLLTALALTLVWIGPDRADAAILRRVVSGSTAMGTNPANVALPTNLDRTKSIIFCSFRTNGDTQGQRTTCEITLNGSSQPQVTLTGGAANASLTVQWYVAEFVSGVSVQRGTTAFGTTATTVNVGSPTLGLVDLAKTFVVISERGASTAKNLDEESTFRAVLSNPTSTTSQLELSRLESGIATTVAWQVVSMDGASVQRGTGTLLAGGATLSLPSALTPGVDTSKSFLLFTRRAGGAVAGIEAEYQVRGDFTTTGTAVTGLTFNRTSTTTTAGHQDEIAWEVVTLTDGTTVQRGSNAGSGTFTTIASTAFTFVDTNRAVPLISVAAGSGTTNTHLDEASFTAAFNAAATGLTFTRVTSSTIPATVNWQVVQFFRCAGETPSNPLCPPTVKARSASVTLNWDALRPVVVLRQRAPNGGCTEDLTACIATAPANGTDPTVGSTVGNAFVVSNTGTVISALTQSGCADPTAADAGTTACNDKTYFYKVFPKHSGLIPGCATAPCYGSGLEVKALPKAGNTKFSYAIQGGSSLNPPITNQGGLFFGSGGTNKVFAVSSGIADADATAGDQLTTPVSTYGSVQAYPIWFPNSGGGEAVIFADQSGWIYSMNALTGVLNWSVRLKQPNSPNCGAGNFVDQIAAAATMQLQTFANAAWKNAYNSATYAFYTGDVIYIGTRNTSRTCNHIFALRATDGTTLWTLTPSPNMDRVFGEPYLDYDTNRLWVAAGGGTDDQKRSLFVIDTTTGLEVSTSFVFGTLENVAPTVNTVDVLFNGAPWGSRVYVGDEFGTLHALSNPSAGAPQEQWQTTVSSGNLVEGFVWIDFFSQGRLYVRTADGKLTCVLDQGATATQCWQVTLTSQNPGIVTPTISQPVMACGELDGFGDCVRQALYVGANDGYLHQINLTNGTDEKQFKVGDGSKTVGDASSDNGSRVYVGTSDGRVYAIDVPLP